MEAKNNPHVLQTQDNQGIYQCRSDCAFERILEHGKAERLKYRRRKGEVKSVLHWGQRKLLLSEIEFLLLHGDGVKLVVYAGAAPGTHIAYLADLFPEHHFVLYDPAPFTVKATPQITCRSGQQYSNWLL